jgi:uncharacterized protein (TIGR03085 family)
VRSELEPPQQAERRLLCDLLLAKGPEAPTLCEGWLTRDLAAHLVIRERDPVAAAGIVLGGWFAANLSRAMERKTRYTAYDELVETVRRGPPPLLRPFDAAINTAEYFVHHEDVRRGGGDTTPREDDEVSAVEVVLARGLRRQARFLARRLRGAGLDVVIPGVETVHARRGEPVARLSGRAGELVLFLMGREAAARVDVDGPSEALAALHATRFGI